MMISIDIVNIGNTKDQENVNGWMERTCAGHVEKSVLNGITL